jgi:ABC-type transport system substrate-binding protein
MDMDDWKTTHERWMTEGSYRAALTDATLDKVEFPDSRHMVMKFKLPFVPMVDRIWDATFTWMVMPKELNADPSIAETKAIGTNYRILDKVTPSVTREYRKHPEYWGGNPFIDRWHEPVIPEYANAYAQFVQGNITNFTPTARDVFLLRKDAPNTVIVASAQNPTELTRHKWGRNNPQAFPWKDDRVRIAFRRSVDYKGTADFLSNRAEFEANGIPIEFWTMTHVMQNPAYWLEPERNELGAFSENYKYNLTEAKKLTAAAGYSGPIDLPIYISGSELNDGDTLLFKYLDEGGIFKAERKFTPANEYRTTINVDGKYDGTQGQSGASGNDIDYVMYRDYHSSRVGGVAFPDAKVDAYAEAQRREPDYQKRIELIKEIQLYLAERFLMNPGRNTFTTFSFRWPWLHNSNYGDQTPYIGGHLQWLDADMPRRNATI